MLKYKPIILSAILSVCAGSALAQTPLYLDESAPIKERVDDLLGRLTIEEKISLLRATSPGIPRLGIPKYYHGNEALHGVVRPGRFTVFPQAISLASSWNPELLKSVSTAISDEARTRCASEGAVQRCPDILVAYCQYGPRSPLGKDTGNLW